MRILVVEDEPELADVLKRGLEEHRYAVDLAFDGDDGLALAEMEPYDLVVLDVMLPGRDGFQVCRRLRAQGRNMPVLMLTARDAVDDRVTGLDSGADDYLTKPFAFQELLARIRALLRRQGASRDPLLRAGDLEINTVTHEVRRGGRPIELTSKEYAILEYFARSPNRVLTRSQIAEHVWDYDFVAMSNVVDVYIRYLRRKLDDDHEPRLLRTIRGTGYQLKVPKE
ncbi:MAG: response regulator transcription factor [Chloroflexi bacterium]|nr:response regulator transcription factor [Chloroflexota bacterium]